jgi:peptide/nickel transport system permease protein/oligopeptide transport system permease protein
MGRFLARRLLQLAPVFFGTTLLIFTLVFAIPGDPIRALAGERPLAQSTYEELRDRYNLDDPFLVQYGKYLAGLPQGDFGQDFRGREVTDIITERFPVTVRLALLAFAIEVAFGILAGILAGLRKGSYIDNLVLVSTTAVISIPVFVLGFVAQILLGVELGWLPIAGVREGLASYVLPAFVLGALSLAPGPAWSRTCAPTTSAPPPQRACPAGSSSAATPCATRSSPS